MSRARMPEPMVHLISWAAVQGVSDAVRRDPPWPAPGAGMPHAVAVARADALLLAEYGDMDHVRAEASPGAIARYRWRFAKAWAGAYLAEVAHQRGQAEPSRREREDDA